MKHNCRAETIPKWPPALILLAALLMTIVPMTALAITVKGQVRVKGGTKKSNSSPAVVWLTPTSGTPAAEPEGRHSSYRLIQQNKQFHPHLLIVPVGAKVEFPNRDPFFHNVFSLFDGKRFDLGLYEAGSTRSISFNRPGISYIFCNIHPEMSAVIIALKTPYYGVSSPSGEILIPHVPPGRYRMEIWREGSLPRELNKLSHEIDVSQDSASLGTLHFNDSGRNPLAHKNLYGHDYDEPKSSSTPFYDNSR